MMRVLIVEHQPSTRHMLREWVEAEEMNVMEAATAADALTLTAAHGSPSTAICGMDLPGKDGIWLAERLRAEHPQTAVIMTTGSSDLKPALRSLHAGAVDHLVYPFTLERLGSALTRARLAHLSRTVLAAMQKEVDMRRREYTAALEELELTTAKALEAMLVLRQPRNAAALDRVRRIAELAVNLALMLRLGGPQLAAIERAVFLQASMNLPTHAELRSLALLKSVPLLAPAAEIALTAHERYDGSGFPLGLREDEIPLSARVIAVAAAYDELASRVQGNPEIPGTLVDILCREGASRFDPSVLDALRQLLPTSSRLTHAEARVARDIPLRITGEDLVKEDPRRRWMRKRLPSPVPVEIGGRPARVVEISYGGCRVETSEPLPTAAGSFALRIPEYRVQADGTCRWIIPISASGAYTCGAAVSDNETRSGSRWRALVDALPTQVSASEWN